jgi:protocatechuate 3,4-dioxygenase alpha subunit
MTIPISPSQTIGPFSHEAWRWACAATEGVASTAGTITISGILRDGDGNPINDGMIEAWSPSSTEAERAHALPGFRRVASGDTGAFSLTLSRTGADAGQPAALVTVFARGLVLHQFTAVFLEDDPALAQSEILGQVPAERRTTLIARKTGAARYAWDINMQGAQETVFFDYE